MTSPVEKKDPNSCMEKITKFLAEKNTSFKFQPLILFYFSIMWFCLIH
jgi:hypothetical protein